MELFRGVTSAAPDPAHDHNTINLGKQREREQNRN